MGYCTTFADGRWAEDSASDHYFCNKPRRALGIVALIKGRLDRLLLRVSLSWLGETGCGGLSSVIVHVREDSSI